MQPLRRLVPNFIIEKYKANEMAGSLEAAAIFVDLSGFSNMVDELSAHGQSGAEVLADLMRQVFEPLVGAVYEQGGFVIGYAGDAFNAVFPADQAAGQAAQRCLSALLKMQAHLQEYPELESPFGVFRFALKTGMGYGNIRWQMFQSKTDKHLTYWMRGEGLNRAVFAEARANPGEIIVDPVALEQIRDVVETEAADGAWRVRSTTAPLPEPLGITEPEPELTPNNLFFSEELLSQPIIGEFRHVVNLFIDIPLNISDEALATPFMETVYDLQDQYGGFFLRPEIGDKGFNLLLFWGAPVAHERDIEHALNFVLELSTRTKLTLRAGISYYTAYAGFMGAPLREDYTAYGWGITLAARLMTYAYKGEFWVNEEIAQRARHSFILQDLGKFKLKGFAEKQRIYQLVGRKSEKQAIYPGKMIGRAAELDQLNTFLKPLHEAKFAGALIVNGDAGIGKSRLLYACRNSEETKDLPATWIEIRADELVQDAFNPFKPWLRRRFGINEYESDDKNWATFTRAIEMLAASLPDPELASELKRTDSVLAALVNLRKSESLYETLDAKSRYENTFIALSMLLRAESHQRPIIIFLEDARWLDDASSEFLAYFMRALNAENEYPIALIASQRPEGKLPFANEAHTQTITLGKLSQENIQTLANDILDTPIDDELVTLLAQRAEGNPFYTEQILRYLSENELLTQDENGVYSALPEAQTSLPMDIRAVMIARLDRLTQKVRETVQTASVLGREFIVDILVRMLHSQREQLPTYVHAAEQASIWAHISEIQYLFHHALLRDAAYSMQLEARQRDLHMLAFSAMEELYQDDLSAHYGELAYHAEKGGLNAKALHYLIKAGDQAQSAYQNRQVLDYFTRALTLLDEDAQQERFALLLKRVEAFYNLGDSAGQLIDLAAAEQIANALNDDTLKARTRIRQAYHASIMGDYSEAVQFAAEAMRAAQKAGDDETLLSAYIVLPDALSQTGKLFSARERAEEGLAFARKVKNRQREASALNALGLVNIALENPASAQGYQEQALDIAREIKDRYLEGKILNNFAISTSSQGDYQAGKDYFTQALAVFREQGNQTGKGLALANLGWVSGMLGEYEEAMRYYERSLVITRELAQKHEEIFTYFNLSATCYGMGLAKEAKEWAETGLTFAQKLKYRGGEAWGYYYLGLAQLLAKAFAEAVEALLKSIEIRAELRQPALIAEARAGLVEAYAAAGVHDAALKEAEAVLKYIEKNQALEGSEEPLRIYHFVYKCLQSDKDPRAATLLQNAKALMKTQVEKLHTKEARQTFVENVTWRRAIAEA